jgi:hypothetical protein
MMHLIQRLCLVALLLFSGQSCATHPHSFDPSPRASESGYPTAEFVAQGKLFHGLGEIAIREGEPLSSIGLEVQGYFEGTIRVSSSACHVRKVYNYLGFERPSFTFEGRAYENCVLDITVSVVFPRPSFASPIVFEMKGKLLVKVVSDYRPYFIASSKIPERGQTSIFVPTDSRRGSVLAFLKGCSCEFIDTLPVVDGGVIINASSLDDRKDVGSCLYEGYIKTHSVFKRITWLILVYARDFLPLPLPSIQTFGGTVRVDADSAVSAIILDGDFQLASRAVFQIDPDEEHTLRLLTVKGRSIVCQWTPQTSEWTCRQ